MNVLNFEIPKYQENFGFLYFLYDEESRLLYVGKTKNLLLRVGTHKEQGRIPFTKCGYLYIHHDILDAEETRHIVEKQPPYNQAIPTSKEFVNYRNYKKINLKAKGKYFSLMKVIRKKGIQLKFGYMSLREWDEVFYEVEV